MEEQFVSVDAALRQIMNFSGQLEFMSGMFPYSVYSNDFEYHFLRERWQELPAYLIAESYAALTSGLDDRSAGLAARQIRRAQRILASDNRPIDLFDVEEMREMYYVRHSYCNEVLALKDGMYAFHRTLLPIDHFEKGIFVDRHGLDLLDSGRLPTGR